MTKNWAVIDLLDNGERALCQINGKRITWPNGSWCVLLPKSKVVKRYQVTSYESAIKKYYKDFPILPSTEPVLNGWVDPKGRIFECRYFGHSELAYSLACQEYGKYDEGERFLETHGWIKFQSSGDRATIYLQWDSGHFNPLLPEQAAALKTIRPILNRKQRELFDRDMQHGTRGMQEDY